MFKNTYQNGLLSIFYSCGSNPLLLWDMEVRNGHIKRLTDNEVNSVVLEIVSTNVATTYITCPKGKKTLGIKLPFLVMIVKNLKRYFSFEICILDDRNLRRRFRISNFQSSTKIKPFCTTMPLGLSTGWNQIQFNLADFTRRAYGSQFLEAIRVQVHANVRLRRIFFCDRLYTEEELPQEYKLFLPLERKIKKSKKESTEAAPTLKKEVVKKTAEKKGSAVKAATPATEVIQSVIEGEPTPSLKDTVSEQGGDDTVPNASMYSEPEGEGLESAGQREVTETADGTEAGGEGGETKIEEPKAEPNAEVTQEGGGEGGDEPTVTEDVAPDVTPDASEPEPTPAPAPEPVEENKVEEADVIAEVAE